MSTKSIRVAVLSDLHIFRSASRRSWRIARAAFKAAIAARADHVVVVGDCFDSSTAMQEDLEVVRGFLVKEGLWTRDRLSLVVGNHDYYRPSHYSSGEWLKSIYRDAQEMFDLFSAWAGELVDDDDRLDADSLFPFSKSIGHLRLSCIDSTEETTIESANGRINKKDVRLLAGLGEGVRHVLAMHVAPFLGRVKLIEAIQNEVGGLSASHMRRLQKLVDVAGVEVVVAGHVHVTDDNRYRWKLPGGQPVFLMGRSGGVDGTVPTVALLDVPPRGAIRWSEIEV